MAYNILKGNVQFSKSTTGSIESMVDDYSNQSVAGVKTFTSPITASAFYDSTAGAPVSASPIQNVYGAQEGRVAIFSGSNGLSGSANLTYDSVTTTLSILANISSSATISGSSFFGTAVGLTELQAGEITGSVSAANINIGNGLNNNSGALEISASNPSINIAANGISVNTGGSTSGILLDGASGLRVDPSRATTAAGLNATDLFLTSTTGSVFKNSISTLTTYLQSTLNFGQVAGADTQVQFNSSGDFGANANFTFDGSVLAVPGVSSSANISASNFYGNGSNLTNINAANVSGNISAANINIGHGLYNNSGALSVSGSTGILVTADGVQVTASATSGLNVTLTKGLAIDPTRATSTGSVAAADIVLIGDNSDSNNLKSATLSTVKDYMQGALTFTSPGGANTQVQYNNSGDFAGSSTFTFNAATNTVTTTNLTASGHVSASSFHGNGSALVGVTATATPAGSNTQIQLNADGSTGASANLTFLTSSNILAVSGQISGTLGITGSVGYLNVLDVASGATVIDGVQISSSLNLSASAFYGDGSTLSNLPTASITGYTNSGNDRIITSVNSTDVNAEANLTFNGTILSVTGQISGSLGITGSAGFFDVIEVGGTTIDGTQISSSLNLSASAFFGDGSNLSGVGGTAWNAFNANYNVVSTHDVMGIDTSGSVVTASLPGASDLSAGKRLVFKDVGGSGSVNNIVIKASGSQTIDGASTVKIQANYGAVTLSTDGVAAYYIISTT